MEPACLCTSQTTDTVPGRRSARLLTPLSTDIRHPVSLQAALPASTVAVLRQLVALFGLSQILEDAGDFLEIGHLSGQQAGLARAAHCQLLQQLRPEAVGLVDAFAISDYVLDSSLGRYDGDVYRLVRPPPVCWHSSSHLHGCCLEDEKAQR